LVRIALIEKDISVAQYIILDPWQDAPDLLAANPNARVPTLVTADGQAIGESQVILF
jgi:glutathione S-transferase